MTTLIEGEALLIRRRMAAREYNCTWNAWLIFRTNPFGCYDHWAASGMLQYLSVIGVPRV